MYPHTAICCLDSKVINLNIFYFIPVVVKSASRISSALSHSQTHNLVLFFFQASRCFRLNARQLILPVIQFKDFNI